MSHYKRNLASLQVIPNKGCFLLLLPLFCFGFNENRLHMLVIAWNRVGNKIFWTGLAIESRQTQDHPCLLGQNFWKNAGTYRISAGPAHTLRRSEMSKQPLPQAFQYQSLITSATYACTKGAHQATSHRDISGLSSYFYCFKIKKHEGKAIPKGDVWTWSRSHVGNEEKCLCAGDWDRKTGVRLIHMD